VLFKLKDVWMPPKFIQLGVKQERTYNADGTLCTSLKVLPTEHDGDQDWTDEEEVESEQDIGTETELAAICKDMGLANNSKEDKKWLQERTQQLA
jgi:hypothetical protein